MVLNFVSNGQEEKSSYVDLVNARRPEAVGVRRFRLQRARSRFSPFAHWQSASTRTRGGAAEQT